MDQALLFPSPNWFQSSGLAVSNDGWLVYGGPSKSLCVLKPLSADSSNLVCGNQGYQAHVTRRAHNEKITCVDICPEWPEKKAILTGSSDGVVKQWSLEETQKSLATKTMHSHDVHSHEKEEVVGVGYCKDGYAVTVGCYGYIVKWDMNSNVVKTFNKVLNNFRPVCMACSPHINLNVAIGTKQGVVFVLDLNGAARVLYKVKGQDDEILKVGWCPQYEVAVRKLLKESEKKSVATQRMEKIRNEPESPDTLKSLEERVNKVCTDVPVPVIIQDPSVSPEQAKQIEDKPVNIESQSSKSLDESGATKVLPEDSFDDQTIVQEDDMFDIYKEPEVEEFGHKKYQPVDILVKIQEEAPETDYLTDCLKLKEDIMKKKNVEEPSIETLVEAMDKTQLEKKGDEVKESVISKNAAKVVVEGKITKGEVESSVHIHKHLLASVGKHGSVRIWSKSGKLVGSCAIPTAGPFNKNQRNQRSNPQWCNLIWYKAEVLLLVDGKSQLLECNPLKIDCKNKLEYCVLSTPHKRGLSTLATNAPRVQPPEMAADKSHDDNWLVWTAAQDRTLVAHSMKKQKPVAVYNTCGGFIYKLVPCPYDAKKIAIAAGDGEVRVWESDTLDDDDTKLTPGTVTSFGHNVQGVVLNVAWHPTQENVLAFSTGEARVGIIDTSGKHPTRPFPPAMHGGVYALAWGEDWDLYASGGGQLALYQGNNTNEAPTILSVELEGRKLELSSVEYNFRGLVVGSNDGAVVVLTTTRPHTVQAATFAFSKMIHKIDWHPQETSSSSEESPYKNLIAVCSNDKVSTIVILEYGEKEDGTKQLTTWKTLTGHKGPVLELAWNPHLDGTLVSTSTDSTARVWNVESGACTAIFGCHSNSVLTAVWSPRPQLPLIVASGGADGTLRLWDATQHPPEQYQEKPDPKKERKKKDKKTKEETKNEKNEEGDNTEGQEATVMDTKIKNAKKFLLPQLSKQTMNCNANGPRAMLRKYLEKVSGSPIDRGTESIEHDLDFIKIFGNINDVNQVLDLELEWHQDTGNMESWMMLCVFRGFIDAMIQYASKMDLLDPYLLSLAPCVSFKYWKDATQLYLAQIDRLVAKGQEAKLNENKRYGGPIYRKTATLLSLHDVKGALAVLCEAKSYLEAYILCRVRYMDSLAEEILLLWADSLTVQGRYNMAAVCYIALGNVSQAAVVLGKSKDEDSLSLAAEIAKLVGQTTFADHVEAKKREMMKLKQEMEKNEKPEAMLELPTRAQLLLNDIPDHSDSESYKDSEKDTKSDIVPLDIETKSDIITADVEENGTGSSSVQHDVEPNNNKTDNHEITDKTEDIAQIADENLGYDKSSSAVIEVEETNPTQTKEDTHVSNEQDDTADNAQNGHVEKPLSGKEANDKDKTDELLEELPSKMEDLMKNDIGQNGNAQNGESNDNIVSAKVKDASDPNDNMDEKGDHLTVSDTTN